MSYSVVILSKTPANLNACLAAIAKLNPGCRVIVVDDGLIQRPHWMVSDVSVNHDVSVKFKAWPEYVDGITPFIFARNANLGIAAAGEDDVILLNDDALLKTPGGFDTLERVAHSVNALGRAQHKPYGIISPATSGVGNENQSLYAGWQGYFSQPHLRDEYKVLCFVCVYIRRVVLNKLGPLDERFVAYGWEDNDYCRRALADGYKLGIYDPVQVEHGTLKSTFRGFGHCDITFNQRLYEEKWGKGKPPLASRSDSD